MICDALPCVSFALEIESYYLSDQIPTQSLLGFEREMCLSAEGASDLVEDVEPATGPQE